MKQTIKLKNQHYKIPRMQVLEISVRKCIAASIGGTENMSGDNGAWGYGGGNENYGTGTGSWE